MKKREKLIALFISLVMILTAVVVPVTSVTVKADSNEAKVKGAFEAYVLSSGNEATAQGLKNAIIAAVGSNQTVTVRESNFYIKHAVDGAKDADANPQTCINIPGSDGAVAAIIKVGSVSYGLTAPIKHKIENLGELVVANLGDYEGEEGTRIINWIGNGDTSKKYKIVVPENTSHINTTGITFEAGNADNIVAIVFLGHKNKFGYEPPQYAKFTGLRAVVMADTITSMPVENAFLNARNLKYVHLSEGWVGSISQGMFKDCVTLENINIPSGVTKIDKEAFYNTALREIVYPESASVLEGAFDNQSFTAGTRNKYTTSQSMTYQQAAAYSCAAISEMKYTEQTSAKNVEDTASAVWTSNIAFNIDWSKAFDGDASDKTIGGTLRLTRSTKIYEIEFNGYFYEEELRAAVAEYTDEVGNAITCSGLLAAVREKLANLTDKIELSEMDFYVKHAVNGVVDEDPDEKTRINIAGSDGAVAAIFEIEGKRVGTVAIIRHSVENLGLLTIPNLGDYTDPDNADKRIINWIGNGDATKKYKLVLPENTSYINTTGGLTLEGGNADNIVALVMLGHSEKLPRYNNFNNLEVVVMADNITGVEIYQEDGNDIYLSQNFAGLQKLKYVHMSEGWNSVISWGMFKDCSSLETLNLPKTINGWIEGYAFAGTALREIEFPNVGTQEGVFADPNLPEGEKGRNVFASGSSMRFVKAAAYAQVGALTAQFRSVATEQELIDDILNDVVYQGDMNPSWNGTLNFTVGDTSVSGTLTLTDTVGDTIPISYSCLLSEECGLSSLKVKYFTLSPSFDKNIFEYTLSLPKSVSSLKITPVTAHTQASIESIVGADDIPTGQSEIVITVVSQNGQTAEYKIRVTRSDIDDPNDTPEKRFEKAADSLTGTNNTTKEMLKQQLDDIVRDENYVVEISDFYKLNAIDGAKDKDGIVVPAYKGYITAIATLSKENAVIAKGYFIVTIDGSYEMINVVSETTAADFKLSSDGLTLLEYYGDAEKVVIPEGVQEIDDLWMVGDSTAIKILVLPETLCVTPSSMCWGMNNLRACYMGNQVTELSGSEFSKCYKLQYVHLSEQIREISMAMFERTFALSDIHIPLSVEMIRNMAFFNSYVQEVNLSANVNTIWEDSFSWLSYNPNHFLGGNSWGVKVPKADIDDIKELIAGKGDSETVINIINPDLNYPSKLNSFDTDGSGAWMNIVISAPKDSTSQKQVEKFASGGVRFEEKKIGIAEAAARAMRSLDTVYITNETSLYDMEAAVMASYIGDTISRIYDWSKEYKLINATASSSGSITGALILKDTLGNAFELTIDRKFELPPEIKSNKKNNNSDSLIDNDDFMAGITDGTYIGNVNTENNADNVENDKKESSKKGSTTKKKKRTTVTYALAPWVIPVAVAGSILGAAVIAALVIIIVKKRKKKNGRPAV